MRTLVGAGFHWPTVAMLANLERATFVLWQRLNTLDLPPDSDEGRTSLAPLARIWEFKLSHLENLLHRLIHTFNQANIECLLLKGSGLAYAVYPSFADRPMSDLDVLVRPEQAKEAWRLAQREGWLWNAHEFPNAKYASHHHLPPLHDAAGSGAHLEIHTDLMPHGHPFRLSAGEVWRDARKIQVDGQSFLVPSLAHQVVHTCLHFAWAHTLQSKSWRTFRDIWAYTMNNDLPWDQVVTTARACRADTCCYWTFRLARNLVRLRVPSQVLKALQSPLFDFMSPILERHYALGMLPSTNHCPSVAVNNFMWKLGIRRAALAQDSVPIPEQGCKVLKADKPAALIKVRNRLRYQSKRRNSWIRYWQALR